MIKYVYRPIGVCSSMMTFWIEDGIVQKAEITGGCDGNLQGLSRLIAGMTVGEVIQRIKGIGCGSKLTSCPDQLARGLEAYLKSQGETVAR